ncbi:MAG: hypothetical protein CSA20_08300 [Deltaproteobacteria bacterium]|nr:MAG: hypothetical protein CSB23_04560 [Deltaproteobacteria bacterium]PIE72329.1 MAG: hypothetical protein CSA20_08300 [Deltaproteobacteria bacterium]
MKDSQPDASTICFGLSETADRTSLAVFLQLYGRPEFSKEFSGRLSAEEITDLVEHLTKLLRRHLSETEYHDLFLCRRHKE